MRNNIISIVCRVSLALLSMLIPTVLLAQGPGPVAPESTRIYDVDLFSWFADEASGAMTFTAGSDEPLFFDYGDMQVEIGSADGTTMGTGSWLSMNFGRASFWLAVAESDAAGQSGPPIEEPIDGEAPADGPTSTEEVTEPGVDEGNEPSEDENTDTSDNTTSDNEQSSNNDSVGHFCFMGIALGDSIFGRCVIREDLLFERGRFVIVGQVAEQVQQDEPPADDQPMDEAPGGQGGGDDPIETADQQTPAPTGLQGLPSSQP